VTTGTIAIIGAPRAGKTTLANELACTLALPVVHADDMIALGWSNVSDTLARLMLGDPTPAIYEGVAVVRALRKLLLLTTADSKPRVHRCIVLEQPRIALSPGQESMRRGCATMLAGIAPELVRRGVTMERHPWTL
jgi:hypothetical protein